MKIAISTRGKTIGDLVDQRFGRAEGFIIVDTEMQTVKYVENSANCALAHGAGINTAQLMDENDVSWVLTGHVGPKAKDALDAISVKTYEGLDSNLSCFDALASFTKEKKIDININDYNR